MPIHMLDHVHVPLTVIKRANCTMLDMQGMHNTTADETILTAGSSHRQDQRKSIKRFVKIPFQMSLNRSIFIYIIVGLRM